MVTRSLASALRQLRAYKLQKVSNQQDLDERRVQVGKMQQIYSRAEQVLVWLGPSSEDSVEAMRTIDRMTDLEIPDNWLARSLQDANELHK
jgi:hypothetical protein